jgi:hypothetical protein
MRFANVNRQEIGVLFIILVNLDDVADLATEGRSGKTPENQYQWPIMRSFANMESADTVQRDNPRVGRIAAHFQRAAMHVRQSVPHHAVSVLRASRHVGEPSKGSQ